MWGFWLHRQEREAVWEGPVSSLNVKHVYAIRFLVSLNMWGFWLHRQKREAGWTGPVSLINVTHVDAILLLPFINLTDVY